VIICVSLAVQFIKTPLSYDWALVGVLFEGWRWRFHDVQVATTVTGELALLLLVALRTSLSLRERWARPSTRPPEVVGIGQQLGESTWNLAFKVRASLRVLAACWLLCLAAIYCNMLWVQPLPLTFQGGANNYHRLMELPKMVKTLNVAGRRAAIDETIALVEEANFVPYDLPHDATLEDWNQRFIMPAQLVRDLARAIDADCPPASRVDQGRTCTLALTNVRLGLMLQRGSTVVECLIGIAVQGLANQRLIAIRAKLTPDQARRVIASWDRARTEAESVDSIINRDAAMAERAYGWAARLANIVDWAGFPDVYFAVREADLRRQTTARLLETDLAIRLYQSDHGCLPSRLDDLVPSYLSTLPPDAYSGQPLIYRTNGDEFTLYSVDRDRRDNGGKFTNMRTYYSRDPWGNFVTGYDFDLDTATRP
jgi:hypothetical protein